MAKFFLAGTFVLLLAACQNLRALTPEEVLQRSMQASTSLSSVSYVVNATHTARNGDHTNVLLQGNLHRESQKNDWRLRIERNGIFIGTTTGVSVESGDPYFFPLPATLMEIVRDHGRTPFNNDTVYQYDVALRDAEVKDLLDIFTETPSPFTVFHCTGTLWIDAESFLLRRSTWDITLPASNEKMKLDITIKNHNSVPMVHVPDNAEERLPQMWASVENILENIPPSLSLLLGIPKVPHEMQ